jgi:hypothetical protein
MKIVYIYLDPRKPGNYKYGDYSFEFEPFYVGQGNLKRHTIHYEAALSDPTYSKSYKHNKLVKLISLDLEPIILILHKDLSQDESYSKEIELISLIGRSDINTGCLTNRTNGGPGTIGIKYSDTELLNYVRAKRLFRLTNPDKFLEICSRGGKSSSGMTGHRHCEETRNLLSKIASELWTNPEYTANMKLAKSGYKYSQARRNALIDRFTDKTKHPMFGKNHSDESRRKISESKTGVKSSEEAVKLRTAGRIKSFLNSLKTSGIEVSELSYNSNKPKLLCKYNRIFDYISQEDYENIVKCSETIIGSKINHFG